MSKSSGIKAEEIAELLCRPIQSVRATHLPNIIKIEKGIYNRQDAYAYINKMRKKWGWELIDFEAYGVKEAPRITRLRVEELSETTSTFTIQVQGINAEDFIRRVNDILKESVNENRS